MILNKFTGISLIAALVSTCDSNKSQEIIVSYSAIACTCAQWRIENMTKEDLIYLEPANADIIDVNSIWDGESLPLRIRSKGKFQKTEGVPKRFLNTKVNPEPGKIFIYTEAQIIKN